MTLLLPGAQAGRGFRSPAPPAYDSRMLGRATPKSQEGGRLAEPAPYGRSDPEPTASKLADPIQGGGVMNDRLPRRQFLQAASAMGLGAGLGPWEALRVITPASAEEARVNPEMVRFRPEIEPVVRWIEETPREQILDKAVAELKDGLSYRSLLAGLFLAGIRNIKPRPVGFKFHAVMVINSAHLLGQSAAVTERLLPLFWALDNFKSSQAADVREGDWSLSRVDESRRAEPSSGQGRLHPGDGSLGRRSGRRGRRGPLPRLGGGRDAWSLSGGWPSATSATSATSRSSRPRAGGPCRRSAGSMPSPCSVP